MQNNNIELTHEIYLEHLTEINGIEISPREIDVIACLLHSKAPNEIAQLLYIDKRTVSDHLRNIKRSFSLNQNCKINQIIDVIRNSNKYGIIKNRYLCSLLIRIKFEEQLRKFSRILSQVNSFYYETKSENHKKVSVLINQFKNHLKHAGFIVRSKNKDGYRPLYEIFPHTNENASYTIYLIAENLANLSKSTLDNAILEEFILEAQFTPGEIVLIVANDKTSEHIITQKNKTQRILVLDNENYYITIFEILKTIYPCTYLDQLIRVFKDELKKTVIINNNYPHNSIITKLNFKDMFKKNKLSILSIFLLCFIIIITLFIMNSKKTDEYELLENKKQQAKSLIYQGLEDSNLPQAKSNHVREDVTIRADFKIPAVLLERPEFIRKIDDKLNITNQGINTVALVGVVGIGGAGKTILARQFAKHNKACVVWEINAERKESLMTSFLELARALATTTKQKQELNSISAIQNIAENERQLLLLIKAWLKEKTSWLLIYDNVENIATIRNYFPQDPQVWGNGAVIITTRDSNIGNTECILQENVIRIEELSNNEKLILFSRIFYNKLPEQLMLEQAQAAVDFLKNIPPFPLDVSAAAFYLQITGTSFEQYLKNLNINNVEFERVQSNLLKEIGGYTRTRYHIITMSLESLMSENKNFKDLILFISLLDSQNIPREIINKFKSDILVDEFIFKLKKYSLITNESSSTLGSSISIHRSTQDIMLAYLTQNLQLEQNKKLLEPIGNALENYIIFLLDKEDFIRMKSLLNHCEAFLKHKNLLNEELLISIEALLGSIYHYTSADNSERAIEVFEDSIVKLRKYNDKNILRARTMTLLADLYRKLGNYNKAEDLLQESCAIYKRNQKNTVGQAYTLASLGLFYQAKNDYQKAKDFLKQSIDIYKFYPESNIGMARGLTYLALIHADLGLYREAINYMEQSQKIYKNQIEVHFRLYWVLMYMGDIYRKLGDYKKAKQLLEESLEIQTKRYHNTKSIDRLRVLSYLGIVYGELSNYKQAINYLEQSLVLYKDNYPKSFDRIWTTAHLTKVYRKVGNYQKALMLIEDSLAIHNNNVGNPSDLRTFWLLAKLGCIHNEMGNPMEAWKILTRILNIYKEHFGNNNIKTIKVLVHLGEVHINLKQYPEAIKIFKESLIQYKKEYGCNHIKTAYLINNLASTYLMENDFEQAEKLLKEALSIFKASDHSECYISLEGLGDLYKKKSIKYLNDGNVNQSKVSTSRAIHSFEEAIKTLRVAIPEENSIHIIRLQRKLEEAKLTK